MIRVIQADDYTGGLNLEANVFQLAANQSSDMLNVDINQRGGVQRRLGIQRRNTSAIGGIASGSFYPKRLFNWRAEQDQCLFLSTDTKVFRCNAGAFTDMGVTNDAPHGAEFASWTDDDTSYLYMVLGHGYAPRKWDETTLTTLTASGTGQWQNDLTTPTGTHMPKSQHVAIHQDRMWVANTSEDGTDYPNRVRFSHPLFPESWREDDYIDVVGGGTGITGIVPFAGHIVIFKPRAVYAIYGYNDDTFQLVELTREVGAYNARSWAVSDYGIYFFSFPEGVYFYDGKGIRDVFQNLRPIIYTAEINQSALDEISMGYANKKLFVSLPTGATNTVSTSYDDALVTYNQSDRKYAGSSRATRATISFVWNETIGKTGAWTIYQTVDGYGYISPITFLDSTGRTAYVAAHPYEPYVFDFDVPEVYTDDLDGTPTAYDSYYVTPWLDAGNYVTKKFWRRPEMIVRRERTPVTLDVDVYRNFNGIDVAKSYTVFTSAVDVSGVSFDGWNDPELGSTLVKADSLGLARAVQLKISSDDGYPWCLNSVAYKYNPRGTRP